MEDCHVLSGDLGNIILQPNMMEDATSIHLCWMVRSMYFILYNLLKSMKYIKSWVSLGRKKSEEEHVEVEDEEAEEKGRVSGKTKVMLAWHKEI